MQQHPSRREAIHELYHGTSPRADRFRYGLLAADIVMVVFLVISSFFHRHPAVLVIDAVFGLYMLTDYLLRLWISERKATFIINPLNVADLIATLSFLSPLAGWDFGFLRVIRILRLLRSYRLAARLRADFDYFKRNEDIINSSMNLFIFVFLMTEIVFVTQVGENPKVTNFLDAMYFTIAALTTTGFGDITLEGNNGRMVSIIVMIFGVSLFLRLMQTVFRPSKVRHVCEDCGLFLHEADAIHCKHCGKVLHIPNPGTP